MSGTWGTELWDQFDHLEKHTSAGIDFLERYSKFVRERAEIELNYAKQLRNLAKKFHPKKSREDESRYTWCLAFVATLQQLNLVAGQKEELAEDLNQHVVSELTKYIQDLKAERKTHFHDGRRAQQHVESSWKQLETSKRRFERNCKEAERAQHVSDRMELDHKTDGDKARHNSQQKQQAAEEAKKEYMLSLNQFNQDQHQHYHTLVPVIYQRIQDMEERRIQRVGDAMRATADAERKTLPGLSCCLEAMMDAAESVQPSKLSLKLGAGPSDCSHLPPDQRWKKLENRVNHIKQEMQREREQRDALLKMKEVYERSPQMGDARSLDPRLEEVNITIQKLEEELHKNQLWLAETDKQLTMLRRQSGGCVSATPGGSNSSCSLKHLNSPASRESPDGSYTEPPSAEMHFKCSDFDEEFDEDDVLPPIGSCRSLYAFQGQNEGTLSMVEGELLSVVEEDKGDGWTRVRRNLEEEGYVPTSYIKVFLEPSAKGFVQTSRLV
ncbi:formin-binding protein 1-like isoform X3 [Synchiropus splendidus]|uniref:formin-binding protein 1-like isoform X3 n=1 Tax=Synchiropus splendidus TaxID=270530 RepID=UPI00237DBE8F|nr:formin-binding protein 1-like isoform X3 [Synchiropus splendidus]